MQAFRQAQVLRDAITRLEGELARAQAAVAEREARIEQLQVGGAVLSAYDAISGEVARRWICVMESTLLGL